jgi:Hsp70 protein
MTYSLGVDLGTTTTAAAVWRNGHLEACTLGDLAPTMPSVALERRDGSVMVGEPARDRARYETTLVARHVTALLGDGGPIVLDGRPHDPALLTTSLLEATLDRVRRLQGGLPDRAVLTHPLFPSGAAAGLIEHVANTALGGGLVIPSPIAAAAKLAYDADVAPGTTVAVLDFGGGTFEVTLVRRTADGFDVIGQPDGIADFGGVEIDDAVLARVETVVGDVESTISRDDAEGLAALRRLRTACRNAKEELSYGRTAVVDVALPGLATQVSVSRAEIEADIRPRLVAAVDLVAHTAQAAGLMIADIQVALLAGGSARIPLLADLVGGRLGMPVVVDPFPELTTALGAALFGDSPGARLPLAGAHAVPEVEPDPEVSQMAAWFADGGPPAPAGPGAATGEGIVGAAGVAGVDPDPGRTAYAADDEFWDEPAETTWFDDDGWRPGGETVSSTEDRHGAATAFWGDDGDADWEAPELPAASDRPEAYGWDTGPTDAPGAPVGALDNLDNLDNPDNPDNPNASGTAANFRGPTTGETDLWGAWPARRRRRPRPEDEPNDMPGGAEPRHRLFGEHTDSRLVLGIVGAALAVVGIAGVALAAGMDDGDEPPIAVVDPVATESTSTSTSTSISTTSTPTSTSATTAATTEAQPGYVPLETTAPETTAPPTTPPPTTTTVPPTTTTRPRPTTTTRPPTTTTSTTVPSTTTTTRRPHP